MVNQFLKFLKIYNASVNQTDCIVQSGYNFKTSQGDRCELQTSCFYSSNELISIITGWWSLFVKRSSGYHIYHLTRLIFEHYLNIRYMAGHMYLFGYFGLKQ